MEVDIIAPSNAKTQNLYNITTGFYDSLMRSEKDIHFNLYLFEQNSEVRYSFPYYRYSGHFNYHRIMNTGIAMSKAPYVCLCNNDLMFTKGWASALLRHADKYPSMSPRCPKSHPAMKYPKKTYEGYNVGSHIAGWCIFIDRKVFDTIGKLDESVDFWYSDNLYAEQLKKHGIRHALITDSVVWHLHGGSNTLKRNSYKNILDLTQNQRKRYLNAKAEKYPSEHPEDL